MSSNLKLQPPPLRVTRSRTQKMTEINGNIKTEVLENVETLLCNGLPKSSGDNGVYTSPYFKSEQPILPSTTKRKPVKVAYERSNNIDSKKPKWEPENWAQVVANIREMRKDRDAPVDGMGCDIWMDNKEAPEISRYHSLISLMLSSQTRDEINHAAMIKLQAHGLTVDNILKTDDKILEELIYPVGFWKKKVQYIKKASQILKDVYGGDIPDSVKDLCSLPGVGPKMAHLCMNVAWNRCTGIGVDTHVHRISNRLGWVMKPTKTPEQTRKELEHWLPIELWQEVNHMLVGFGQQICRPITPRCDQCLNKSICPIGQQTIVKNSMKSNTQVSKILNPTTEATQEVPEVWKPENWVTVLHNIREEHIKPATGKFLCHLCVDGYVSPSVLRYQALISQVLKRGADDKSVDAAMHRLRKYGLTVENIANPHNVITISELIHPLQFNKKKSMDIVKLSQILLNEHQSDLPVSLEKLMTLPGVEPKTALICMNFSRDDNELSHNGALVANRLGWVQEPTKTVLNTAKALEAWVPTELKEEVFHLLGAYSNLQCKALHPACDKCPNQSMCPFYADKQTLNPVSRPQEKPKAVPIFPV